jgi:hypothetical protein
MMSVSKASWRSANSRSKTAGGTLRDVPFSWTGTLYEAVEFAQRMP